jgi:hypothetical protein
LNLVTGAQVIGNQDLGFVPQQGTSYTTSLTVKNDPNNINNYLVDFSVGSYTYSVANGGNSVSVAKSTVGNLDQVGFELLGTATGTFDNLSVTFAVPEPASLSLLAFAGIALHRRRRA